MSSSEYKSETESNAGLILSAQLSQPTPPPLTSPSSLPLPLLYEMSQHDLHAIIRQQQEQLAAMQMQIQALIAKVAATGRGIEELNRRSHMEVAKPPVFNGEVGRVGGFITACKLYLRMKMRETTVEEQVQWILSYIQEGSADIWKENILEDLEAGEVEYELAREFLAGLKREFGGEDEEAVKVAELRKLE